MRVEEFFKFLNADFFTGVPDSQLRPFCDFLMDKFGIDKQHHIIGANEGNCAAMAAGYHLATKKVPVVYMQNSGQGNIINPLASLLNDNVYAIPCIFIVGWRGEPNVHDEPQHVYQGKVTLQLFKDVDVDCFVVDKNTNVADIQAQIEKWQVPLSKGKQVAFIIKKGALEYSSKHNYANPNPLLREEIIKHIVKVSGEDPIISTTGKASRELFEVREHNNLSHKYDFLTVGSMGHCSSIALSVAINKPETKIWCVDGDGAALMHLGAMPAIGAIQPQNLVHIVINNSAHETVGGMPTVANKINFIQIAKACGYKRAVKCKSYKQLDKELQKAKHENGTIFIEVICGLGARDNLGRPTISAVENKNNFMQYLSNLK